MKTARVLSLLILLAVAGCGSPATLNPAASGTTVPGAPPPELSGLLPPLPAGDSARAASYIHTLDLPGIATADDFGNVVYGATSVELLPPELELAGVIYALPVNGFSYDEITFEITFDDPQKLWLAIGDYQRGCWVLTPAHVGITSVAPPYPTAHAPDGCAYFAVLAWDGATVAVNQLAIAPNIPTWQHHLIHGLTSIGDQVDMIRIGDYLYTAYEDPGEFDIRLARAVETIPSESGHWELTMITDFDDACDMDLAEVNSLPALIYSTG